MKIFEHKTSCQAATIISVEKHRIFSPAGKAFLPLVCASCTSLGLPENAGFFAFSAPPLVQT
jgi:hypothetical protein